MQHGHALFLLLIKCHQWGFVNTCLLKCKEEKKGLMFFSVPGTTTGGRHSYSDQVGLQPGPVNAPMSSQIFLQTAG